MSDKYGWKDLNYATPPLGSFVYARIKTWEDPHIFYYSWWRQFCFRGDSGPVMPICNIEAWCLIPEPPDSGEREFGGDAAGESTGHDSSGCRTCGLDPQECVDVGRAELATEALPLLRAYLTGNGECEDLLIFLVKESGEEDR